MMLSWDISYQFQGIPNFYTIMVSEMQKTSVMLVMGIFNEVP